MIAVSPFSKGGHISHVYNEHSSFVKFIERNGSCTVRWHQKPRQSADPVQDDDDNDYVRAICRQLAIYSTCSISIAAITIVTS